MKLDLMDDIIDIMMDLFEKDETIIGASQARLIGIKWFAV